MSSLLITLMLLITLIAHPVQAERDLSSYLQSDDATPKDVIESPTHGQAVQGSVVVYGNIASEGFLFYEVDLAYSNDATGTWFLVQESTSPVQDGILAIWDTTTINDGEYTLRLLVGKVGGTTNELIITGLRVRNYTPIETETPNAIQPEVGFITGPTVVSITPLITPSAGRTSLPVTPTPLPTNPAEISSEQAILTLGKGAGLSLGIFAVLGIYLGLHALVTKRK